MCSHRLVGASLSGPACIRSIRHHDATHTHKHTFLAFEKDNSVGRMSVHGVVTNEQAQVQAVLNHLHLGFWALTAGKKWVVAQAP